jgi:Plasmid pRiA4b ORF-3-like protein
VPTSITLKVPHDIIQVVIGWLDYHLWEFTISKHKYGLPMDDDWGTEPHLDVRKVRPRDALKPQRPPSITFTTSVIAGSIGSL